MLGYTYGVSLVFQETGDGTTASTFIGRGRHRPRILPWEEALAALKRGARAAADDGAPTLYEDLFGHTSKAKATKVKGESSEPPAQAA